MKKNHSNEPSTDPSSPTEKVSNSLKRSRIELKTSSLSNSGKNSNDLEREGLCINDVANQVVIETLTLIPSLSEKSHNRLEFINSQKINRYSSSNCPSYLIHTESIDSNIGNLHQETSVSRRVYYTGFLFNLIQDISNAVEFREKCFRQKL